MIGNDGGGGKEMVRSSGGRSFQRNETVVSETVVSETVVSETVETVSSQKQSEMTES